jgi:hypothetical protein
MMENDLEIYGDWDLNIPEIPPRSYLYHLKPRAIGTPFTESLTSYFSRLVQLHCLTASKLFRQVIAPHLERGVLLQSSDIGLQAWCSGCTDTLNGTGKLTSDFVRVLKLKTLNNDLHFLTLLLYAEILPFRALLSRSQAWCPDCYEEWRTTGQVIYNPLLWSLAVVEICPKHHRLLVEQCSHCQRKILPLEDGSRPGYCPKCEEWLGSLSQASTSQKLSKDELKWQFYLADNIGELIAAAPRLSSPPSREIIASKITNCINQITLGDTAKFASLVGLPGISVGAYRKGNSLPGIDKLLKICYCLEISLLNFLTKEVSTALCLPKVVAIPNKRRRKPYNKPCVQLHKNLEQVRQKMQAALEEEPPPSLTQMAQRFGCSTTVILSKHLPDLSNQIKVRYRDYQKDCLRQKNVIALEAVLKQEPPPTLEEVAIRLGYADTGNALYTQFPFLIAQIVKRSKDYRKACAQERLERADVEVWQAALELHSQGKKPTDETVKLILKKPGLMRSQKARKTLQKFRQEYGYEK